MGAHPASGRERLGGHAGLQGTGGAGCLALTQPAGGGADEGSPPRPAPRASTAATVDRIAMLDPKMRS